MEINKTMNDWPKVRIGDVFKKFAPVLKAYTSYINQFDKSAKLLEEWEKKSKPFNQFLEVRFIKCKLTKLENVSITRNWTTETCKFLGDACTTYSSLSYVVTRVTKENTTQSC
jgi:type IV secretory pathway TrbF-like protein